MNITLEQTGGACPEQYEARDEYGRVLGRLRLQNGQFAVEACLSGGEAVEVYTASPVGDGVFDPDEREHYLAVAIRAIRARVDPSQQASREVLADRLADALKAGAISEWPVGGDGPVQIEIGLDAAVRIVLKVLDTP